VLSNLAPHTYHRGSGRVGPAALVMLSVPLVCADPLRHVLQDTGMWSSAASHMYLPPDSASTCEPGAGGDALCRAPRAAGGYGHHAPWVCDADRQRCVCPEASIRCLSRVGWVFTIFCTYLGFACLFAGACARKLHALRAARMLIVRPPRAQACCGVRTCRGSSARCSPLAAPAPRKTEARAPPGAVTRTRAMPSSMTPRRSKLGYELRPA
jgi:hypothetical protein